MWPWNLRATDKALNPQTSDSQVRSPLSLGIWPGMDPRSPSPLLLPLREDLVTGAEASDMAFVSVSINCNFL